MRERTQMRTCAYAKSFWFIWKENEGLYRKRNQSIIETC